MGESRAGERKAWETGAKRKPQPDIRDIIGRWGEGRNRGGQLSCLAFSDPLLVMPIEPHDIDHDNEPLLQSLKADLPALETLLDESDSHWGFEDPFYRLYHQSWKVLGLQNLTLRIVEALRKHDRGRGLNDWFLEIVAAGTGKTFSPEMNRDWLNETRPILEAFFHAKTFLSLTVRYAKALDRAPRLLPSGWAAVLSLYNVR